MARSILATVGVCVLFACGGAQRGSERAAGAAAEEPTRRLGEEDADGAVEDDGPLPTDEDFVTLGAVGANDTARRVRITFLDVGQGDAILIQLDEVDILLDGGPALGWARSLEEATSHIHGDLEIMFVSHPHDDHFYGAVRMFEAVTVRRVITNGEGRGPPREPNALERWSTFVEAVAHAGITLEHVQVDEVLEPAPGLSLRVLATGSPSGGLFPDTSQGTDINNDSLVMMLEFGGRRVLLTGDIENAAQQHLVNVHCQGSDRPCDGLHADVLKVPHHGSSHSEEDFFRAVGPRVAVISADYDNRNGRHCLPRVSVVEALHRLGSETISTSAEGTDPVIVWLATDGSVAVRAPPTVFAWDDTTTPCSGRTLSRSPDL